MLLRTMADAAIGEGEGSGGLTVGNLLKSSLGTSQNSTPTAAQLFGGYVTQTSSTGAGTITTPTGAILSAGIAGQSAFSVGDSFQCVFANLGGGFALTVTAGVTGMTVIGTAAIPSAKTALLLFVCTATSVWDCVVVLSA